MYEGIILLFTTALWKEDCEDITKQATNLEWVGVSEKFAMAEIIKELLSEIDIMDMTYLDMIEFSLKICIFLLFMLLPLLIYHIASKWFCKKLKQK